MNPRDTITLTTHDGKLLLQPSQIAALLDISARNRREVCLHCGARYSVEESVDQIWELVQKIPGRAERAELIGPWRSDHDLIDRDPAMEMSGWTRVDEEPDPGLASTNPGTVVWVNEPGGTGLVSSILENQEEQTR